MFGSKRPEPTSPSPAPSAGREAERETPAAGSAVPAGKPSQIAEGLSIVGEMSGDGDVDLDGRLEGNLRCRALVIGKSGELAGTVTAQQVTVHGTVRGDIRATQVQLSATATVIGDVHHEVLEVAAGARIEGRYSHGLAKAERKAASDTAKDLAKEAPPKPPQRPLAKPGNGAGASAGQARPSVAAEAGRATPSDA